MSYLKSLSAGLAGAIALNILHETLRQFDHDAPRVDLLGEEALTKTLHAAKLQAPAGDALYLSTLAGDLLSNTLYFSLIGGAKRKNYLRNAVFYGLSAGAGAVFLPKPLGLDETPVTRTSKTKLLTIGYYLFGGLVTAAVLTALQGSRRA